MIESNREPEDKLLPLTNIGDKKGRGPVQILPHFPRPLGHHSGRGRNTDDAHPLRANLYFLLL